LFGNVNGSVYFSDDHSYNYQIISIDHLSKMSA